MTSALVDDTELNPNEIRPSAVVASRRQCSSTFHHNENPIDSTIDKTMNDQNELIPPVSIVETDPEPGVHAVAAFLRAPTAEARKSQIAMSLGVFVLSLSLGASALCFYSEILETTGIESGLLLGSVGTLSMCTVIIVSYLRTKWYRRHMHIILLNLALCEFCLALSFLLEPVWNRLGAGVGSDVSCRWLSTAREYLLMCSSAWTTCTALDLYYLMTNPFTSPRLNRHKYQAIAHVTALASAVIMCISKKYGSPVASGKFCWVGADTQSRTNYLNQLQPRGSITGIWVFIVAPATISMIANLYVTFVSYNRIRRGVSPTLRNRKVLLREGFLTTVTLIGYSALLWGVYGAYWLTPSVHQAQHLSRLFAFLLSYRGSVPFILWCLYNRPKNRRSKLAVVVHDPKPVREQSQSLDEKEDEQEDDDAVRPQMNLALLDELVFYTTHGIAKAVRITSTLGHQYPTSSMEGSAPYSFLVQPSPDDSSSWTECRFTAFRPLEFQRIRRFFGIQEDAYLLSLKSCTTPKVSEGASGSFVYYSLDRSFLVKSLTRSESVFLHSILSAYMTYMEVEQGASLLTRFLGSYCLDLYGRPIHFIVMENVFDVQKGISIHQRYDIKGSWIDRNAQKPRRGAEATCRHCNLSFRWGSRHSRAHSIEGDTRRRSVCPNRAGAPHEPNVVLKDMDLTMKLRFGKPAGYKLLTQLMRDSDFLCACGVMDYSLLLGVIEVSYLVNRQNILTRDGSVFLPPDSFSGTAETSYHRGENDERDAALPTDRLKQSTQCLRAAEVVIGPGFYYIGIIDMLQTWNFSKRFERFIKTVIFRKDPDGISAMPPKPYRDRFHRKLREIIHLGHNANISPSDTLEAQIHGTENVNGDTTTSIDQEYDRMTDIRPRGVVPPIIEPLNAPDRKIGWQLRTMRDRSEDILNTPSVQGHVLENS